MAVAKLHTVVHVEEISRTQDTITYDTYLDGVCMGRTTSSKAVMNLQAYEYFRREQNPDDYIQRMLK